MIKQLSSLCNLLFTQVALPTQRTVLEREFSGRQLKKAIPLKDGFLILGHQEWTETLLPETDGLPEIRHLYRPFVARINKKLNPVWEKFWPEHWSPTLSDMELTAEKVYLIGTNYLMRGERGLGCVTCLTLNGEQLWEQNYHYPRLKSVEGKWIKAMPDGSLLTMMRIFPESSSMGTLLLLNLDAAGGKRWSSHIGRQYRMAQIEGVAVDCTGNVLLTGHIYRGDTEQQYQAEGWMYLFDPEEPDNVLMDKVVSDFVDQTLGQAIPLKNGHWWVLSHASEEFGVPRQAHLIEYNQHGEMVRFREWQHQDGMRLTSMRWNDARDSLVMVGMAQLKWLKRCRSRFIELTDDWEFIRERFGSSGSFYIDVHAFNSGDVLLVGRNSLQILG